MRGYGAAPCTSRGRHLGSAGWRPAGPATGAVWCSRYQQERQQAPAQCSSSPAITTPFGPARTLTASADRPRLASGQRSASQFRQLSAQSRAIPGGSVSSAVEPMPTASRAGRRKPGSAPACPWRRSRWPAGGHCSPVEIDLRPGAQRHTVHHRSPCHPGPRNQPVGTDPTNSGKKMSEDDDVVEVVLDPVKGSAAGDQPDFCLVKVTVVHRLGGEVVLRIDLNLVHHEREP